ncbi:hypothetical protein [Microbacterium sp.]|uniref:hypothetical protein n=1 Tax=Microbacterium sp. TaxID=51671 RepID=UPI0039E65CD8
MRAGSEGARLHTLSVGAWMPGALVRLALLLVVVAVGLVSGTGPLWQWLCVGAAAVAALVPRTMAAWLAAAMLALGLLLVPPELWRTAVVVGAVHAVHVLGSLALAIPVRSRVQLRVLVPTVRRFVAIQAVSQSVVLAAGVVLPAAGDVALPWAAPVGALALLGVALLLLRSVRGARE